MSLTVPARARLPLLGLGALALIWGMWLGLSRMGAAPAIWPQALADHGALMVGGFLGTVISLERAVASGKLWPYLGPFFCAVGVALFFAGKASAGAFLLLVGSVVVVAVLVRVLWVDRAIHHVVLGSAAVGWAVGNALLAFGRPVFELVPFWMIFLVGTISAERLELNRLLPRTRLTRGSFLVAFAFVIAGAVVSVASLGWMNPGMRLLGLGELALAFWLFRFDIARRTVRQHGPVRFIAAALLSGYFWLGTSGVLALIFGNPVAGPRYDALLHSVFVGFVFSMIFGHALVIIPAVLAVKVEFRPRFYLHLGLLHLSLAARISGDLLNLPPLRQAGGWLNAAAILLFVGSTALAVRRSPARKRPAAAAQVTTSRGVGP